MPIISAMFLRGVSVSPHQNTERSMQRSEKEIFTVSADYETRRNPEYFDDSLFPYFCTDYAAYGNSYVYEIFYAVQAGNH